VAGAALGGDGLPAHAAPHIQANAIASPTLTAVILC